MNKYTVVFGHKLPFGGGVAMYHCSFEVAESAEKAAEKCKASLGGYCIILTVFEGHQAPVLRGAKTICWDNEEQYKTKELDVPIFEPANFTELDAALEQEFDDEEISS